jgi:hypothetical protein
MIINPIHLEITIVQIIRNFEIKYNMVLKDKIRKKNEHCY